MSIAASTNKRGLKRICMSCSTRFYDFNKRPIVCPNCETEFTGDMKVKIRRSRIANDDDQALIVKDIAIEPEIESIKDLDDDEAEESDTVSLDDVEEDSADDDEETIDADLDLDEEDLDDDADDDDDEDDDLEDEDDEE